MAPSKSLALAALTTFASAQLMQIPPNFTPSTDVRLRVSYNGRSVTLGSQLGIEVPAEAPVISTGLFNGNNSQRFVVMMIDPDAPTPEEPTSSDILHWLAPDQTWLSDFTIGGAEAVVPYARPMPPPRSSAHRYIQYLFYQPSNFSIPAAYSGYSAENRSMFDANAFIAAAGLGQPVAANYFLCSNGTDAIAPYAIQVPGYNGTGNGTSVMPTGTGVPYPPVAVQTTSGAAGKAAIGGSVVLGAIAMALL